MMLYTDAVCKRKSLSTIDGEAELMATYNFPDDGNHAFVAKIKGEVYALKLYRGLQLEDFMSLKEKYYDELDESLTVEWLLLEGFVKA